MINIDEKVTPVQDTSVDDATSASMEASGNGDEDCTCGCDPRTGDLSAQRLSAQIDLNG